ncbi:MAG TPA: RNA 2',3'-cyclic phosphodiesterase [Candidatus Wallbacteria bacterium]|nr:RNA 2',3'-cyclic phosphodiesterase [Candidatus Wallbacteria bacterium]
MALKRLFIGSFVDSKLIADFYKKIKTDFKNAVSGKWVEENNLHITHKFLGDVEEDKISSIKEALMPDIDRARECELYFSGPDTFSLKNPRILFIKAEDTKNTLAGLNSACERAMVKSGFSPEDKPFNPHITIMRMKSVNANIFGDLITGRRAEAFKAGPQREIKLSLIESVLTPAGPVYKII